MNKVMDWLFPIGILAFFGLFFLLGKDFSDNRRIETKWIVETPNHKYITNIQPIPYTFGTGITIYYPSGREVHISGTYSITEVESRR